MLKLELKNEIAARIADFLTEIGLEVAMAAITGETVLSGIQLDSGTVLIDETKLGQPGDLLHEAGHVAVTPSSGRKNLHGDVAQGPAEEMAAIAWSYAAAIHLRLDPAVVFHAEGYRGGSESMLNNFCEGRYIGLPMLQWMGMAYDEKKALENGKPAYPAMLKWLRD